MDIFKVISVDLSTLLFQCRKVLFKFFIFIFYGTKRKCHFTLVKLQNSVPVKSVTKAEQLRECLRSLNRNHKVKDFVLLSPTCSTGSEPTRVGSHFTNQIWVHVLDLH